MTTYSFPAVTPSTSKINLASNTATFTSPLSGAIQTIDRGGERWILDLQYTNLSGDNLAAMQGFLSQLNGQQHRFTLHNHVAPQRGTLGGTPLVAGAGQTGNTLSIDGCSGSTNWIRAGDWFSVNGELKIQTVDANAAAGAVTLTFAPRLRASPANNAAITTSSGTGTFILAENGVSWSNAPGGFSSLSIRAVEDIAA